MLRRYTDLAPLLHLLQKRALTVLSPRAWDDRNDSYFLESHKRLRGIKSVLALCFTDAPETYHHWRVFSGGLSGVCLEFDKRLLSKSLEGIQGLRSGVVTYMTIKELQGADVVTLDLPFIKRYPYRDECEFRIVLEDATESLEAKDLPFSPAALKSVVVNPWMPRAVFNSVKAFIKGIDGWTHLLVRQTTLIDNERWRECAAAVDEHVVDETLRATAGPRQQRTRARRSRASRK